MAVTLFSFPDRTRAGTNYTGSGILCFYLFRDEKFFAAENPGQPFFTVHGIQLPARVTSTPAMHTCLCSCKNTAKVPYPVCKPCYDSADYKGFKQFSAMNPVRTIWG